MFLVGQVAYPIYPRDLVFGILPFAILAFLRATDGERTLGRLGAGRRRAARRVRADPGPAPAPDPDRPRDAGRGPRLARPRAAGRPRSARSCITGSVALPDRRPWLVWLAGVIGQNGGFSIDSSADLLPVRIGFWDYPIQFGLILPLAVIGAGVGLLFLRRPDGPRPNGAPGRWAPRPPEGGLLLVAWWVVPWTLAVLYQPSWPLEDALRPQRLWLIASQPGSHPRRHRARRARRGDRRRATLADPTCRAADRRRRAGRRRAGHGRHDAAAGIDLDRARLRPSPARPRSGPGRSTRCSTPRRRGRPS